MSVRTKSMTHFITCVTGLVEAQLNFNTKAEGLAGELFSGVKALAEEHGLDNLLAEFDKSMVDAEAAIRDKLPEGETLSKFCPAFKSRKSAIRSAIAAKLDPTKFESYNKFVKANKKADAPAANNKGAPSTGTRGYTEHDDKGGVNGGTISNKAVADYTDGMPSKHRKALEDGIRTIKKLLASDPESALDCLTAFSGNAHSRLSKVGGRLSNVGKKTPKAA